MPMMIPEELKETARSAAGIVADELPLIVLTGAGISVGSGIPPFRGPGGLWDRYDPYEYGHIDTFRKHPERSWKMLKEIIDGAILSEPNEAHYAISRMEKEGWVKPVVTQNIDGLHVVAGTEDLIEIHGNARRIYCMGCGNKEMLDRGTWDEFSEICECGSFKRPDIVFFGEQLPEKEMEIAFKAAYTGRSMIVVGTSGVVQPVAMLPAIVKAQAGRLIEINLEPTELTVSLSDVFLKTPAEIGMRAIEEAFRERFS
ncbi:MAG: Sir2 family NAD-dependent protein deacetylase [Candidatus Thermoplasmatota archaeon]|nr:Sir2 family NAD-dependent protein deacetylase [Candidatus Thermoplasmatota archaeon]